MLQITHLNGLDTFKWRPSPKHNTHKQGHFEITQPYMQYLHSKSLPNYACGV